MAALDAGCPWSAVFVLLIKQQVHDAQQPDPAHPLSPSHQSDGKALLSGLSQLLCTCLRFGVNDENQQTHRVRRTPIPLSPTIALEATTNA